jgi:hypothetical protein
MKKRLLTVLVVVMGSFLLSASIVWAQDAPVAKTGQTSTYRTGDDGHLQKGVTSPSPRFIDNGDGTVSDKLTGLMWTKNANLASGTMSWTAAITYANNLSLGSEGCGGSYTDWRLPNLFELESLRDMSNYNPALPTGHSFTNVQSSYYSSSTHAEITYGAWIVSIGYGFNHGDDKTYGYYV